MYGVVFSDTTVPDINSHSISTVEFTDGYNTASFSGVLEYKKDKTPVIDNVMNPTGHVFGGYDLTLSGSYLDIGTPSIMIDGVECVVKSNTDSQIVC